MADKNSVNEKQAEKHDKALALNKKLGLPRGVNWEGERTTIDYGLNPRLSKLPDMFRQISVSYMAFKYSRMDEEDNYVAVLDAGAGFAELYLHLRAIPKARGVRMEYLAIDVDPRKRDSALGLFPNLDYRLCDFTKDFEEVVEEEEFDIVLSTEVLEHLSKEDGIKYLDICMKKLASGGHLILTTPSEFRRSTNPWHIHEWDVQDLKDHFIERNWIIVDSFYMRGDTRKIAEAHNLVDYKHRMPNDAIRSVLVGDTPGAIQAHVVQKP